MFWTSFIRTMVPIMWSAVVGWLLMLIPALEPVRELLLDQSDTLVLFIGGAFAAGWYALTRWLEPKLPDWLSGILMGSAKTPEYSGDSDPDGEWSGGLGN